VNFLWHNLENKPRHSWESSNTVYDLVSLAAYVRKHRWLYIGIVVLIFASSVYFYHTRTYYNSRITFLVNSSNVAEVLWDRSSDGPIDVVSDDRGFNRINQIVYSSQMMDYLINKFDLYKHYRIDKDEPESYLEVIKTLKQNIDVNISKTKIITVQISDPLDFGVAAEMANAIGKKINDINRQITVENLTRKTEMFESLAKDLKSSSQREFSQMDSLMKSMQRFLAASINDAGYRQLLLHNIQNLQSKSDDYFRNLFESYKYRLFSMYSLQEKNLPTISVLEKALPDEDSKSRHNIVVIPLLIIFSILVPLVFFFLVMKANPLVSYVLLKSGEIKKLES